MAINTTPLRTRTRRSSGGGGAAAGDPNPFGVYTSGQAEGRLTTSKARAQQILNSEKAALLKPQEQSAIKDIAAKGFASTLGGLGSVLDFVQRPAEALMYSLDQVFKGREERDPDSGGVLADIFTGNRENLKEKGVGGSDARFFASDFLGERGWEVDERSSTLNRVARFGVSLGLDVALDPTSYVTGGASGLGAKASIAAARGAVKTVSDDVARSIYRGALRATDDVVLETALERSMLTAASKKANTIFDEKVVNALRGFDVDDEALSRLDDVAEELLERSGDPKTLDDLWNDAVDEALRGVRPDDAPFEEAARAVAWTDDSVIGQFQNEIVNVARTRDFGRQSKEWLDYLDHANTMRDGRKLAPAFTTGGIRLGVPFSKNLQTRALPGTQGLFRRVVRDKVKKVAPPSWQKRWRDLGDGLLTRLEKNNPMLQAARTNQFTSRVAMEEYANTLVRTLGLDQYRLPVRSALVDLTLAAEAAGMDEDALGQLMRHFLPAMQRRGGAYEALSQTLEELAVPENVRSLFFEAVATGNSHFDGMFSVLQRMVPSLGKVKGYTPIRISPEFRKFVNQLADDGMLPNVWGGRESIAKLAKDLDVDDEQLVTFLDLIDSLLVGTRRAKAVGEAREFNQRQATRVLALSSSDADAEIRFMITDLDMTQVNDGLMDFMQKYVNARQLPYNLKGVDTALDTNPLRLLDAYFTDVEAAVYEKALIWGAKQTGMVVENKAIAVKGRVLAQLDPFFSSSEKIVTKMLREAEKVGLESREAHALLTAKTIRESAEMKTAHIGGSYKLTLPAEVIDSPRVQRALTRLRRQHEAATRNAVALRETRRVKVNQLMSDLGVDEATAWQFVMVRSHEALDEIIAESKVRLDHLVLEWTDALTRLERELGAAGDDATQLAEEIGKLRNQMNALHRDEMAGLRQWWDEGPGAEVVSKPRQVTLVARNGDGSIDYVKTQALISRFAEEIDVKIRARIDSELSALEAEMEELQRKILHRGQETRHGRVQRMYEGTPEEVRTARVELSEAQGESMRARQRAQSEFERLPALDEQESLEELQKRLGVERVRARDKDGETLGHRWVDDEARAKTIAELESQAEVVRSGNWWTGKRDVQAQAMMDRFEVLRARQLFLQSLRTSDQRLQLAFYELSEQAAGARSASMMREAWDEPIELLMRSFGDAVPSWAERGYARWQEYVNYTVIDSDVLDDFDVLRLISEANIAAYGEGYLTKLRQLAAPRLREGGDPLGTKFRMNPYGAKTDEGKLTDFALQGIEHTLMEIRRLRSAWVAAQPDDIGTIVEEPLRGLRMWASDPETAERLVMSPNARRQLEAAASSVFGSPVQIEWAGGMPRITMMQPQSKRVNPPLADVVQAVREGKVTPEQLAGRGWDRIQEFIELEDKLMATRRYAARSRRDATAQVKEINGALDTSRKILTYLDSGDYRKLHRLVFQGTPDGRVVRTREWRQLERVLPASDVARLERELEAAWIYSRIARPNAKNTSLKTWMEQNERFWSGKLYAPLEEAEQKVKSIADQLWADSLAAKQRVVDETGMVADSEEAITMGLLANFSEAVSGLRAHAPEADAFGIVNRFGQEYVDAAFEQQEKAVAAALKRLKGVAGDEDYRKLKRLWDAREEAVDVRLTRTGFLDASQLGLDGGELAGHSIDRFTAQMFQDLTDNYRALFTPWGVQQVRESASAVYRYWKAGATVARPAFHVRNLLGGVANGFLIGVGPKDYTRVLPQVHRFREAMLNPRLRSIDEAIATLDDWAQPMFRAAWDRGVLSKGFSRAEDMAQGVLPGAAARYDPVRVGGIVMEMNEDVLRMAAFHRWFNPAQAGSADLAAEMVTAVHFDYQALTSLERHLKRFAPFFVWTRRNVPLQLRALLEQPGYASFWAHLADNVEDNFGDRGDFPINSFAGPFAASLGGLVQKGEGTQTWARLLWDPDLPIGNLDELPLWSKDGGPIPISPMRALNPAEWLTWTSNLLGPQFSLPMDVLGFSEDPYDTYAPTGLNGALRVLEAVTPLDMNVTPEGQVMVPKALQTAFNTAFPMLNEYRQIIGLKPNSPAQQAREGFTGEGLELGARLRNMVMAGTGARGLGPEWQTPQDTRSRVYDAEEMMNAAIRRINQGVS